MKKYQLLIVAILFFSNTEAQSDSAKWVKEINEQVWKPFITHFTSRNHEGFRDLHSKRITRVEIDQGILKDYEKYFPPVNSTNNNKNYQLRFELRFDKRISDGTKAWETGYYKGTVIQQGKEPRSYYGRFFVLLEKENGIWKILVDADTGKGANEQNFSNAFAME